MNQRTRSLILTGIVLLGALTAFAQAGKDGVVTINGGRKTLFLKTPSQTIVAPAQLPAGIVTIYSNLGKNDQVYNAIAGSGVVGDDSGQPRRQWVACAFIPKANHLVQAIRVGASYVSGTNELALMLAEDAGGVPGKTLHAWKGSNLPIFGNCCVLQTAVFKAGIPVKANTTYWVILRTTPRATDTFAVWNDNIFGLQGRWDNDIGTGWINEGIQMLGAFGVYGQ